MFNYIHRRFIALVIIILIGVVSFLVFLNFRMQDDIVKLRTEERRKHSAIFEIAVDVVGNTMRSWMYDNTYWDEMYQFVINKDENWAIVNIAEAIPVPNVHSVWILDGNLKFVYSCNIWSDSKFKQLPFTKTELEIFLDRKKLLSQDYPHFYTIISDRLFELRAMPIQPSSDNERKTEPIGYMIAGRYWNDSFFKEFSKITFSQIKLVEPQKLSEFDKNISESEVEVGSSIELKNLYGNKIAYLGSSYNSHALQELIDSTKTNLPITLVCVLILVGALVVSLFYWVIRPLKIVATSLIKEDEALLKPIRNQKTEFGLISGLIHQFFEQRTALREEVFSRTQVEKELREIKTRLEVKVEERTADLVIAKEKAEESNRIKSIFLTNMSHELRTPLFGIIGNADLLMELGNEPAKRLSKLILRSGERLKSTLNNLLDLARVEAGKIEVNMKEYVINEVLDNIVEFFNAEAKNKGLNLQCSLPTEAIIAKVDLKIFEDAINNLLQNAIKFTFAGDIFVSLIYTEKDFIVSIKDSGIGIPEENLGMIFDQFRQASEGIGKSYDGSGLGLALTKKYVECLGGTIMVSSEHGKGSEFSVRIPHHKVVTARSNNIVSLKASQTIADFKKNKKEKPLPILLVEDDQITQEVIKLFLHDKYEIDLANNASEALSKVRQNEYMAVLMDINLGRGLNGVHVTKEIRLLPGKNNLPIVAQTAFAMKGDREEFLEAGCNYYLAKPFSKEELRSVLLKIHGGREA